MLTTNLNRAFLDAALSMRNAAPQLSHKQQVTRLYKKSLKLLDSWVIDRRLWNEEATKIRASFDANKAAPAGMGMRLLREANEKLVHYTHPDPYVIVHMPGGSKFMRNPPVPLEVCFPDGVIPDDVEVSPLKAINIDTTPYREDEPKETILVDFTTKSSY
jgi:NADH dehydrogenase (ubiquinone) 1 beta subcomplex subunit 9